MALAAAGGGTFGVLSGFFGQYSNDRLKDHCDSGVDTVILSFVTSSPENEPSGLPGTNFAGHCWKGTYANKDGVDSDLQSNCYWMKRDIPYCKSIGVKILLSIGGESTLTGYSYSVGSDENGESFADFLYGAFGPYNSKWTGPRPFDIDETHHTSIDGFDFDIENSYDNHPYIAMINRFRSLDPSILITGSPQCPLLKPWAYMSDMVQAATFDRLNVQFYNNPGCNAAPDSALLSFDDPTDITNSLGLSNKFNYDDWEQVLAESDASRGAKIFIALPASKDAAQNGYLTPDQLKYLICKYKNRPHFGGISLWDLSFGKLNIVDGKTYQAHALNGLQHGCGSEVVATSKASVRQTTSLAATISIVHTSSKASQYGNTTMDLPTATSQVSAWSTSSQSGDANSARATNLSGVDTRIATAASSGLQTSTRRGDAPMTKATPSVDSSTGLPGVPAIGASLGVDIGLTDPAKPTPALYGEQKGALPNATLSLGLGLGSTRSTDPATASSASTRRGDEGPASPTTRVDLAYGKIPMQYSNVTSAGATRPTAATLSHPVSGPQAISSQFNTPPTTASGGNRVSASSSLPCTTDVAEADRTAGVHGPPSMTTWGAVSSDKASPTAPVASDKPSITSGVRGPTPSSWMMYPAPGASLKTSTKSANAIAVVLQPSGSSSARLAGTIASPSTTLTSGLAGASAATDLPKTSSRPAGSQSTASRQAYPTASGVSATNPSQVVSPGLGLDVDISLGISLPDSPTQLARVPTETSKPGSTMSVKPVGPNATSSCATSSAIAMTASAGFVRIPSAGASVPTSSTRSARTKIRHQPNSSGAPISAPTATTSLQGSPSPSLPAQPSGGSPGVTTGSGGWNTTAPAPTSTATVASTVYTIAVQTITKCPPGVDDCPVGRVTTETVPLYTTTLLMTQVAESPIPAITEGASWTRSTVLTTQVHTIASCAPDVVDCPVGQVVTKTIPLYTTYCPVTATAASSGFGLPTPVPQAPQAGTTGAGIPIAGSSGLWTTTRPSNGFARPSGQPGDYPAPNPPNEFYAPPFPNHAGASDVPAPPKVPNGAAPVEKSPAGAPVGSGPSRTSAPVTAGASVFGASVAGVVAVLAVHVL